MSKPAFLYGVHAVAAALAARPGECRELWLSERSASTERLHAVRAQAEAQGIPVQTVSTEALNRHTDGAAHQGIAVRTTPPPALSEDALPSVVPRETGRLLILDGVTDPQNLGASLRVAEAAGVHAVLVPAHRRAPLSAAACKAASGAAERVPLIQVSNLGRALRTLRDAGTWLYAADGNAETNLWQATFELPWALVVGAEGRGVRAHTRQLCDVCVQIPMAGQAESMNVSCAAAVALFAAGRPRGESA